MQHPLALLTQTKERRGHAVAHLQEVGDRQVPDRIGIGLPQAVVPLKRHLPVMWKQIKRLGQHHAILKGRIHSLAVEGDDRVGGVADENDPVTMEPGRAPNRHQRRDRVSEVLFRQRRHQRQRVREMDAEEPQDIISAPYGLKAPGAGKGPEECARE